MVCHSKAEFGICRKAGEEVLRIAAGKRSVCSLLGGIAGGKRPEAIAVQFVGAKRGFMQQSVLRVVCEKPESAIESSAITNGVHVIWIGVGADELGNGGVEVPGEEDD